MELPNKMEVLQYHFRWRTHITRHKSVKPETHLESPDLQSGLIREWKWRIRIYPVGKETKQSEYPLITFMMAEGCPVKVNAFLTCSEVDGAGFMYSGLSEYMFPSTNSEVVFRGKKRKPFTEETSNIRISCDLIVQEENMAVPYCHVVAEIEQLTWSTRNLYSKGTETDFTLISKDKKPFCVHKAILMARSYFFNEMFSQPSEVDKPTQLVTDIDSRELDEILRYIYTGAFTHELKLNTEVARKFYLHADFYKINSLKRRCLCVFLLELDRTKVVDHLMFASMHGISKLKQECLKFIARSIPPGSLDWENFVSRCPSLIEEVRSLKG